MLFLAHMLSFFLSFHVIILIAVVSSSIHFTLVILFISALPAMRLYVSQVRKNMTHLSFLFFFSLSLPSINSTFGFSTLEPSTEYTGLLPFASVYDHCFMTVARVHHRMS